MLYFHDLLSSTQAQRLVTIPVLGSYESLYVPFPYKAPAAEGTPSVTPISSYGFVGDFSPSPTSSTLPTITLEAAEAINEKALEISTAKHMKEGTIFFVLFFNS